MHFTNTIAAVIVAYASIVSAAPANGPGGSAGSDTSNPPPPPPPPAGGLSLTQQLFIADTAVDRLKLLPENKDFVFDFSKPAVKPPGKGGEVVQANRKTFPALVGTSSAMAVGRIRACGINTFHVHPRSAELQIVIKGKLVTEMVPENGVVDAAGKLRVIRNELGPLQMTPFYQGSVHTQYNPECEEAVFVASFAHEDPGAGFVAQEAFASADNDLITATFGQTFDGAQVDKIRAAIPASIALGVESCLKKCNIPKA